MDIPSREIHGNVHSKKQVMAETCEPSKCGCRASRTLKDVVSHDGGRRRVRPPTNAGRPKATGNKPNGTALNSSWYSVLVQVATGLRHVEMLSLRQQHVTEPTAAVTRFVQCLFSWGGVGSCGNPRLPRTIPSEKRAVSPSPSWHRILP